MEDETSIVKKIRQADVICVVYAVDNLDSLVHARDHWLPLIRSSNSGVGAGRPVILVGNKVCVWAVA